MKVLTPEEFENEIAAYDDAVRASEGIDRFCSSHEWVLAARTAFAPEAPSLLLRGANGYAAFVRREGMLMGLDTEWGFSCPLVGDVAREFAAVAEAERWRAILLPGIVPGSRRMFSVIEAFARHELRLGPTLRRWTASLEGGLDGYLMRRTRKLRENLRRAARRAKGVEFERGGALDRAIAVERKSWKGEQGGGILPRPMQAFYRGLVARLGARTRMIFARKGGEDVGFILGGVRDGTYRGFQFSYDERVKDVSLGGLLQLEQIRDLAAEGVVTYDMGMDMSYKRRWADGPVDTVTIAVVRRNEGAAGAG